MDNNSKAETLFGQTDFVGKTSGITASKFNTPRGIYIDNFGRMWVSGFNNHRIVRFSNAAWTCSGRPGPGRTLPAWQAAFTSARLQPQVKIIHSL